MHTTKYTEFHVYRPSVRQGIVIVYTAGNVDDGDYTRPPLCRDEEGHFPGRPSEPRPCPLEGRFFVPTAEVSTRRIEEEVAYMALSWVDGAEAINLSVDPELVVYSNTTGTMRVKPRPQTLSDRARADAAKRDEAEAAVSTPLTVDAAIRWLDGDRVGYAEIESCARRARLPAFTVYAEAAGEPEAIAGPFVLADPPPTGTAPPTVDVTSIRRAISCGARVDVKAAGLGIFQEMSVFSARHEPKWAGVGTLRDMVWAEKQGLFEVVDAWRSVAKITGAGRAAAHLGANAPEAMEKRIMGMLKAVGPDGILRRPRKDASGLATVDEAIASCRQREEAEMVDLLADGVHLSTARPEFWPTCVGLNAR